MKQMNKKNIIITGGLGYIGTELCKLYSGEARFNKITVIDNKFYSERVRQLRNWGINFVQASILDEVAMEKHLKNADIVFHLAGITDVAYTQTESNSAKDLEIKKVGIDGTRNVMKYITDECKLIFPSTHVVFEGFKETRVDIDEYEETCPILTYASGKVQSEIDICHSNKNVIILRLGSVYGYSLDSTRMNIMPNLFSKIAALDGTIGLFSGGVQLKSLVSVVDVARCMKFMSTREDNDIYHLANESMTVKEVAKICQEVNPKIQLFETNDEIPNLGYTISNAKLLSTGFEFRYNIKDCIKEMIENWSVKELAEELEYIITGGKEFIDDRGKISNYELPEPINLIGHIESKQGTVRANHYHPIQEQKCLLVSGQYISVIKDLSDPDSVLETKVINPGDIAVIQPNVAHAMVFTKDSVFLNLVRGEREHENYGVTHTIPYKLVDEKLRYLLLLNYKTECRVCGSKTLTKVISLGLSPLANDFKSTIEDEILVPLQMDYCNECHNCQLSCVVPPQKMFTDYAYVSSTAASFRKHFSDAAEKYIQEFNLTKDSIVIDIGSNDGVFLGPLKDKGIQVIGFEPAKNIAKIANEKGIRTINEYFSSHHLPELKWSAPPVTVGQQAFGKVDLITASNVFAHTNHIELMVKSAFDLLKEDGTFIIEVQYVLDTIKDLTFDNIYHEHVQYWNIKSLERFFNNLNLMIYKVEHINTHGGSIRVYIKRASDKLYEDIQPSLFKFIEQERNVGLYDYKTYRDFGKNIVEVKKNVIENIKKLKASWMVIAIYGAPAKATTALNYFGLNSTHISYAIEDNALKVGKYIPGTGIPIKSKEYCNEVLPNIIIVMAWNFFEEIKKSNQALIDKGVTFISIKDLYKL